MLKRSHCSLPNLEARGAGNRSEPAPRQPDIRDSFGGEGGVMDAIAAIQSRGAGLVPSEGASKYLLRNAVPGRAYRTQKAPHSVCRGAFFVRSGALLRRTATVLELTFK